jgi:WD40 repeat protein
MVWDIKGFKLLRILDQHSGPVVSVSVNPVNGYIYTLTAKELRLYTINGDLLATSFMTEPSNPKPKARVVMALPIGEWQDGFVAVTGHDAGHVYLWKLVISIVPNEVGNRVIREFEPFPLPKTHRSDITVLRLCSSNSSKTKSLIPRVYEGENFYELLIGDNEGYASRWAPGKLEQLSPSELQRRAGEMNG